MCRTVLTDLITLQPLQTFTSTKFVVRVAFSPTGRYWASASYDRWIVLYEATSPTHSEPTEDDIPLDETDDASFASDPTLRYVARHRIQLDTNPESILFDPQERYLLYTVRNSCLLFYLHLGEWTISTKSFNAHPLDTHVSFSVLNLALHPSGRLVGCQTGDHQGRGGERVLIYGLEPDEVRLAS